MMSMRAVLFMLWLPPATLYHLTVLGGSGSGDYPCGATVPIVAETHHGERVFAQWFPGWDGDTAIAQVHQRKTVLTMPCKDTSVEAKFTAPPPTRHWWSRR